MNTKPLVYALSAVAIILGALFLISTISAPSLDPSYSPETSLPPSSQSSWGWPCHY